MRWTKIGTVWTADAAYTIRGPIGGKWVLYGPAGASVSRHSSLTAAKRGARRHWDVFGGLDDASGARVDRRKRGDR